MALVVAGVIKEEILWRWWNATGSQLMLLGVALITLAVFLRLR